VQSEYSKNDKLEATMKTRYPECQTCYKWAGWAGTGTSAILALLKFYIGWVGGSKGLIADAMHSTICIASAGTIFLARSFTQKKADDSFPWGYGKVEFLASGIVSLVILGVVTVFMVSSLNALMGAQHTVPHMSTALIVLVSIVANEIVFRFLHCVGTQYSSATMISSAWANRSDCFSSLAVLVGIVGSRLGIEHLDPIMALVVTLIIYKVVGANLLTSIRGLMDYSGGPELTNRLKKLATEIPDVNEVSSLKTRSMGQFVKVDMVVKVPSEYTAEQADGVALRIKNLYRRKEKRVGEIMVGFLSA